MKKIALFSLVCCTGFITNGFAGTCGPITVTFDSAFEHSSSENWLTKTINQQHYDDNEFLYENADEYKNTKYGYKNSNGQNSGDGHAWECDSYGSSSCRPGDITTLMPANHYFQGKLVTTPKKYQCKSGDDRWVEYIDPKEMCQTNQWGDIEVGKSLDRLVSTAECSGMKFSTEEKSLVTKWRVSCISQNYVICTAAECVDNYTAVDGRCVAGSQCVYNGVPYSASNNPVDANLNCSSMSDNDLKTGAVCQAHCLEKIDGSSEIVYSIKQCPQNLPRGVGFSNSVKNQYKNGNVLGYKKCLERQNVINNKCDKYKNNPEALACCKYEGANWNDSTNKCDCDENKKWSYDAANKVGMCIESNNNETCWYRYSARFQCPDGKWYKVNETIDVTSFVGLNGCNNFGAWLQTQPQTKKQIQDKFCNGAYGVITPEGPSQAEISNATGRLDSLFKSAETNADVWKDAEGKFNTARLASDLTAGVVLGTVGGVVSGVVITKTQKEKGFDALHCTVGGQKMADWGDVFQVTFRR